MRDNQYPGRSVVMSTRGMIATSQPMATQTGLAVLQQGGNAMDAAIAELRGAVCTEPQATGIGGDCFLLYHEAETGKLHGLNGSGRAPARATPEEFERRGLMQVPEFGILSVIVPGAVDAWQTALERFGTRSLEELLQPAIAFAADGYAVTPVVAQAWQNNTAVLAPRAESRRDYLVNGRARGRHAAPPAAARGVAAPRRARRARGLLSRSDRGSYRGPQPCP